MPKNTFVVRSWLSGAKAAIAAGELDKAKELLDAIEDESWSLRTGQNWRRKVGCLRAQIDES